MPLNLNVTESSVRNRGARPELHGSVTPDKAREILLNIRAQLVGKNGTVESGYLKFSGKNGTTTLTAQSRILGFRSDKQAATHFVGELIDAAYGEKISPQDADLLADNLTSYFDASGGRFGTQSFVKLINSLETLYGAESQGELGRVADNARLETFHPHGLPETPATDRNPAGDANPPVTSDNADGTPQPIATLEGAAQEPVSETPPAIGNPPKEVPQSNPETAPISVSSSAHLAPNSAVSELGTLTSRRTESPALLDALGITTLGTLTSRRTESPKVDATDRNPAGDANPPVTSDNADGTPQPIATLEGVAQEPVSETPPAIGNPPTEVPQSNPETAPISVSSSAHLAPNSAVSGLGTLTSRRTESPKVDFRTEIPCVDCGAAAKKQFEALENRLKAKGPNGDRALEYFSNLLHPLTPLASAQTLPPGKSGLGKETYVLGDADGSICRVTLAAMNCGMMALDDEGLDNLASIMLRESEPPDPKVRSWRRWANFQSDQTVATQCQDLLHHATFSAGDSKLVCIGDILHDRYANNKKAMASLIESLHGQGAVFIKGNHDVYEENNPNGEYLLDETALPPFNRILEIKAQNGFYGTQQLTKEESDALTEKCFVNAHFDESKNLLFIHNGVEQKTTPEGHEVFSTGLGDVTLEQGGVKEFVSKVNGLAYRPKESGADFTNFRPSDRTMSTDKLGAIGTFEGNPVIVVHGHDSNYGVKENVINVNARALGAEKQQVTPVLMVI